MTTRNRLPARLTAQQGIALLTSILFLLVLAMIGLSIMKISLSSVQVAHNDEMMIRTFNQAELALRTGELDIRQLAESNPYIDFYADNDYFYVAPLDKNAIPWVDTRSAGNDTNGRYVIEYQGTRPIHTESASMKPSGSISGSAIHLSRVISRDQLAAGGARRMIRSTYATLDQP